jgi:hypothetical protein
MFDHADVDLLIESRKLSTLLLLVVISLFRKVSI